MATSSSATRSSTFSRRAVIWWLMSVKRLAGEGRLFGYRHEGFWKPADTFKERAELDANYAKGIHPWMVWDQPQAVS